MLDYSLYIILKVTNTYILQCANILNVSKKGKTKVLLITKVTTLGLGIPVTITLKSAIHIKPTIFI